MLDRVLGRDDRPQAPLTTTSDLAGHDIVEVLTLVGAGAGDEGAALRELARRGAAEGADAVVGVRVASTATGSVWWATRQCFAYGTAVLVRRRPGSATDR
jgi:hypothetical protein